MVNVLIARVQDLESVPVESQPNMSFASRALPLGELIRLSNQNKLVLHLVTYVSVIPLSLTAPTLRTDRVRQSRIITDSPDPHREPRHSSR